MRLAHTLFGATAVLLAGCGGGYRLREGAEPMPGPEACARLRERSLGIAPFRHLFERDGAHFGSGCDYSDEVIDGARETAIFGQVAIATDEFDPDVDYVVLARLLGEPDCARCQVQIWRAGELLENGFVPLYLHRLETYCEFRQAPLELFGPDPATVSDQTGLARALGEYVARRIAQIEASATLKEIQR